MDDYKKVILFGTLVLGVGSGLFACGKLNIPDLPSNPISENAVVRAKFILPVSSNRGQNTIIPSALTAYANANQEINGTVAPEVLFTLSNANWTTPATSGIASYGSLDITNLFDNHLRVCGQNGNSKCTAAFLRIYTTGAAGAGLWSNVENIGLPILTSNNTIGLNTTGAHVLALITIGSKRVIKLSDFTASSAYTIPISVDFRDAASGTYSSTIVVEYGLQ